MMAGIQVLASLGTRMMTATLQEQGLTPPAGAAHQFAERAISGRTVSGQRQQAFVNGIQDPFRLRIEPGFHFGGRRDPVAQLLHEKARLNGAQEFGHAPSGGRQQSRRSSQAA